MVDDVLSQAEFYALGKRLEIQAQTTSKAVSEGLDYLVKNIFSKFNYLTSIASEPINEIKQILQCQGAGQGIICNDPAGQPGQTRPVYH
jgi:hypothetical protein